MSAADVRAMRWDGRDGDGVRLPSGIYLVRLENADGRPEGPQGKVIWLK